MIHLKVNNMCTTVIFPCFEMLAYTEFTEAVGSNGSQSEVGKIAA